MLTLTFDSELGETGIILGQPLQQLHAAITSFVFLLLLLFGPSGCWNFPRHGLLYVDHLLDELDNLHVLSWPGRQHHLPSRLLAAHRSLQSLEQCKGFQARWGGKEGYRVVFWARCHGADACTRQADDAYTRQADD